MKQRNVRPLDIPLPTRARADDELDDADERLEEDSYKGEFASAFFLVQAVIWGGLMLVWLYRHERAIVLEIEGLPSLVGHKLSVGVGVVGFVVLLAYRFWSR